MINFFNMDCMEFMRDKSDKFYDLAIVDPPYGIGINHSMGRRKGQEKSKHKKVNWDNVLATKEYFNELFRVSKNQIIWGGNYFICHLYNTSCFIVWDKDNTGNFADCELAWTSFVTAVRKFKHRWNGMIQEDMKNKEHRIHPTQKPVELYKWLLQNYAKTGDKIIDTHGGSMSSAIACHDMNFDLDIIELDKDYYKSALERFKNHTDQLRLM